MLEGEGKDEELSEAVVLAAWRRIVGESLREQAVPFRLYRKTLVVAVASETWKKHLEALSGQMLFKLNAALGKPAVTFIEFRIDERTVFAERELLHRSQTSKLEQERIAMKHVPPSLIEAAQKIENESLRRNFLLAAGSCLARKAQRGSRS